LPPPPLLARCAAPRYTMLPRATPYRRYAMLLIAAIIATLIDYAAAAGCHTLRRCFSI